MRTSTSCTKGDVPNTDDTDDNADGEDDRTSPPVRGGMWVWKLRAELDKARVVTFTVSTVLIGDAAWQPAPRKLLKS